MLGAHRSGRPCGQSLSQPRPPDTIFCTFLVLSFFFYTLSYAMLFKFDPKVSFLKILQYLPITSREKNAMCPKDRNEHFSMSLSSLFSVLHEMGFCFVLFCFFWFGCLFLSYSTLLLTVRLCTCQIKMVFL